MTPHPPAPRHETSQRTSRRRQVRSGERLLDVDGHGFPTEEEILLPVRSAGRTVGGFVLTSATRVRHPAPEQLRVGVLLADQVGTVVAKRRYP